MFNELVCKYFSKQCFEDYVIKILFKFNSKFLVWIVIYNIITYKLI